MFTAIAVLIVGPVLVVLYLLGDLMRLTLFLARIFGLLKGIFRFVFSPINYVFRYRDWMRRFEYRQGQLMRASHGAAASLLALFIGWHLPISQPVLFLVVGAAAVWGVVVFIDGARKSRGDFDWYLGKRAFAESHCGRRGAVRAVGFLATRRCRLVVDAKKFRGSPVWCLAR